MTSLNYNTKFKIARAIIMEEIYSRYIDALWTINFKTRKALSKIDRM